MTEYAKNVNERLQETFACHPRFPIKYYDKKGIFKDRVAIHDAIHLLIIDRDWPVTFTMQDEYSAAIVQAVLRREKHVSYRKNEVEQESVGRDNLSIAEIKDVIANVPVFMRQVLRDWCISPPDNFSSVDDAFINRHYKTAVEFDRLFQEKYKKPFYRVAANELMEMEFEPLKTLYQTAKRNVKFPSKNSSINNADAIRAGFSERKR